MAAFRAIRAGTDQVRVWAVLAEAPTAAALARAASECLAVQVVRSVASKLNQMILFRRANQHLGSAQPVP
jgi:hypothetical protein